MRSEIFEPLADDESLATGGASPDPLALPMVSGFGQLATDKDGTRPDALAVIDFYGVRDLVDSPQQVEKSNAQWLIPGTHKSRKGHDRSGTRPVIWADIDEPQGRTVRETGEIVASIVGGCDFEVYASRSATAEKQKCRVLIPLAQALPPHQWLTVSAVFRRKLTEAGIETDKASEVLGQVLYLPNRGEFYDATSARDGDLFQPLAAWADEVAEHEAELKRQAQAVKQAQEAARTRREALQASRSTSGFKSAIDAFNVAYDVSEILTRNGYAQRGNTFKHPASESGNFSASVKNGRVHSLSTSDPLHSDGQGAHDAFSAFCVLEHGGNRDDALKAAGDQWLTIGGESWNKVQRREWAQQQKDQRQAADHVFPADFAEFDPETGEQRETTDPLEAHPLARFVELAKQTPAVRWIIPGVIEHGVVTISGARGVGKTTALLPLAMVAAGLHATSDPLAPKPDRWRHVVYIVEDIAQAQRIISGMVRHGDMGIKEDDVRDRLHLVEARRLPPAQIAQVGRLYADRFTRQVNGVEVLPLVVFDTKAAVFELGNENDNSEASHAMAAIKQEFEGLPCWVIGHIAKASFGRDDVASLSDRGAGAFEADAIQNVYLVQDAKTDKRLMLLGKRRFEARWTELEVQSHKAEIMAVDEWGDPEQTTLRWGRLAPMDQSRTEARAEAEKNAETERRGEKREAIMHAVQVAWQSGNPLSRTGAKAKVTGKASEILKEIDSLVAEGWLHEIDVPQKQRIGSKARFLICLDTPEHDEWMSSHKVPEAKMVIPESWKRPAKAPVPEVEAENAENEGKN